jgi:hypothetical protein
MTTFIVICVCTMYILKYISMILPIVTPPVGGGGEIPVQCIGILHGIMHSSQYLMLHTSHLQSSGPVLQHRSLPRVYCTWRPLLISLSNTASKGVMTYDMICHTQKMKCALFFTRALNFFSCQKTALFLPDASH